jgi:extracellular factor (EF) 3-hydroxypalmitic acid methyl ester biosynthesis protein
VHQVLKEGSRLGAKIGQPQYDYIYCAGLFDYLTDKTCKQIMHIFYDWLAPGGLLAITNVVDCKPFRHMLEFLLDWHLIYRNTAQGYELVPEAANPDECRIFRDETAVNLMVEVRKPSHA